MLPVASAGGQANLLRGAAAAGSDEATPAATLLHQTASAGLAVIAGGTVASRTAVDYTGPLGFIVGPGRDDHDITAQRPAWAQGLRATILPEHFTDALGSPVAVQSVSPATLTTIVCAGQTVGYFTGSVVVFPLSPLVPLQLAEFGAGTLWLMARLIDSTAPADALAGLPISFGLFEGPGITLGGGTLTLPGGSLTAAVAQAGPPAAIVSGDAAAAGVFAPSEAVIAIGAGSIGIRLSGAASANIYGLHIPATAPGVGGARYVTALNALVLPLTLTAPPAFAPVSVLSTLFAPEGTAPIIRAEWALLVTHAPPAALAEAEGPGGMLLTLADGLSARIEGEAAPAALTSWQVLVGPRAIVILAVRSVARAEQTLKLWAEGAGATATIASPADALVSYLDSAAGESLRFAAVLALNANPPVTVDGEGLSIRSAHGFVALSLVPAGLELVILATPDPPAADSPEVFESFPFAIDNALLRCLWPELVIGAAVLSDGAVVAAGLDVAFPLASILPTLPDPYASSHEQPVLAQGPLGTVSVIVLARDGRLAVSFAFTPPQSDALRLAAARLGNVELLDVSTNADLAGVQLGVRGLELLDIEGLTVRLPEPGLKVITVPHISWEPLLGASAPISFDDGPQTQIFVVTQTPQPDGGRFVMVPAEPVPALDHVVTAAASGAASVSAQFSLPFGLRGFVEAQPGGAVLPDVRYVQPAFAGALAGGRQASVRATGYPGTVGMPGKARTTSDASRHDSIDPGDYGARVLGSTPGGIATFFLRDFEDGAILPVNRIDLSGYGASLFSHWHRDLDVKELCDVGVDDVKFDVMVGRTNYEFVEARSWLFPWCVPVVRTLTIARNLAGVDVRTLRDWRASDDSRFEILLPDGINLALLGPVARVTSVRNIRETGEPIIIVNAPLRYARVTFDADILIDPELSITKGAIPGSAFRIAAFGLVGYIQVDGKPCTTPDGATAVDRATLADLISLVLQEGAARGTISCAGAVQGSGLQFAFSGVELGAAQTALVGALRAKPVLPADGAWSLARRVRGSKAPEAVDPKAPVPLIRGGGAGTPWTIAEPADALHTAPLGQPGGPALGYGVLQDTGTQKVYFEQPTLAPGSQDVNFRNPPQLADASALLGAAGVFPDIGALIAAAERTLKADAAGLGYSSTGTLPASFDRPLLTAGPVSVLLRYRGTRKDGSAGDTSRYTVTIQPSQPRYSITIQPISLLLTVDGLAGPNDPLLTITGTISATDGSAPGLHDVEIVYGSALGLVTDLLSGLQSLSQFLPGQPKSGLSLAFNGGALSIRDVLALPTIPLGIGQIEGVALNLGMTASLFPPSLHFDLSLSTPDEPFHWLVSPLSGNGAIGFGATDDKHSVLVQGGIGVGLGVDFGIASGSASVCIALRVDQNVPPIELTALLTGNAQVDVLDGLASTSISLTAGVGLAVDTPKPALTVDPSQWLAFVENVVITMSAEVAVGIHVSVCWLVHVDVDESWRFSETISPGDVLSIL